MENKRIIFGGEQMNIEVIIKSIEVENWDEKVARQLNARVTMEFRSENVKEKLEDYVFVINLSELRKLSAQEKEKLLRNLAKEYLENTIQDQQAIDSKGIFQDAKDLIGTTFMVEV